MAASGLMLVLAILFTFAITANGAGRLGHTSYLKKGSSLSVNRASDIIQSQDGTFSFGFYNLSPTAFTLSIWFTRSADRTIAWSANRDHPVHGIGSKVRLNKDGTMVLTDYDGTIVWQTNTSSKGTDHAELMDSGNLAMKDQGGNILWQSFDHPTNTLLPTQPVTAKAKLVSTDLSHPSSYYTLRFDDRYILSLAYDGPEISNLYWPNPDLSSWLNYRISYNSSRKGVLDNLGQFIASDNTSFVSTDWGPGIKRRLTLDYDGNLRLYSMNDSDGSWSVSWMAFSQPCDIHGLCGWNGICVYTPVPACFCPPGYVVRDPNDWSKGCKPTFNFSCGGDDQPMSFVSLPHTDFWGSDLDFIPMTSLDACATFCLNTCSCLAFEYKSDSNDCYLKSVLLNGKTVPGYPGTAHLKVPQNFLSKQFSYTLGNSETLDCNASSAKVEVVVFDSDAHSNVGNDATLWYYLYGFLAAFFLIEVCFIAFGWWFMVRKQLTHSEIWAVEEGYKMVTDHFRSFTYKELSEATKNFKDELGHGSYGPVYKGILHDKRVVAVKKLGDVKQGEDEFHTEASIIGQIYHMNLVRVRGVCSEQKHRLLVFEYVENGSLAMALFGNRRLLQWDQRYNIAVGVAKGLAYLHHECFDWIIHCDIKPENILLDNDFEPKISDFGVAKLLRRDQTDPNMSKVRGTRGYAAPEWAHNIPINEKVDVYSYGVVLLELVAGRRASELTASGTDDAEVAMRQLVWTIREKLKSGDRSWITGFVDPKLSGNIVDSEVWLILEVAAMCMEKERSLRPSMNDIGSDWLPDSTSLAPPPPPPPQAAALRGRAVMARSSEFEEHRPWRRQVPTSRLLEYTVECPPVAALPTAVRLPARAAFATAQSWAAGCDTTVKHAMDFWY
ncbi:hypothetical protein U9M48_035156 [Paspalum notatum var. saurae]|uniref:Receptor-like serine/threonine-protein kinase n=1 Tax=Paspalum notatum var. saurae TaxID=547442 RepID=A0AAQ3X7F5_PASNO